MAPYTYAVQPSVFDCVAQQVQSADSDDTVGWCWCWSRGFITSTAPSLYISKFHPWLWTC